MALLGFLRKANAKGDIIRYIVEKHKKQLMEEVQQQRGEHNHTFAKHRKEMLGAWNRHKMACKQDDEEPQPLAEFLADEYGYQDLTPFEAFANDSKTSGEKLIAATTNSMLNDRYYAQWLALTKPLRKLEDFQDTAPEVMEKVNEKYTNFALCLHHAPDFWHNDEAIRAAMELEAHSKAFIETILNKVQAQRHIVKRYLDGEIAVDTEVPSSADWAERAVRAHAQVDKHKLTKSQKCLAKKMGNQLATAVAACQVETDEDLEACIAKEAEQKLLFASGPPGTGKTHVIHEQVRKWKRKSARVLFALPTGQLASEVRSVHPDVDVDTSHGAFLLHRPLQEAMAILTPYELVIIDKARWANETRRQPLHVCSTSVFAPFVVR